MYGSESKFIVTLFCLPREKFVLGRDIFASVTVQHATFTYNKGIRPRKQIKDSKKKKKLAVQIAICLCKRAGSY